LKEISQKFRILLGKIWNANYAKSNIHVMLFLKKKLLKDYFEVDGAKYELFNMPKPSKPYLVLE